MSGGQSGKIYHAEGRGLTSTNAVLVRARRPKVTAPIIAFIIGLISRPSLVGALAGLEIEALRFDVASICLFGDEQRALTASGVFGFHAVEKAHVDQWRGTVAFQLESQVALL